MLTTTRQLCITWTWDEELDLLKCSSLQSDLILGGFHVLSFLIFRCALLCVYVRWERQGETFYFLLSSSLWWNKKNEKSRKKLFKVVHVGGARRETWEAHHKIHECQDTPKHIIWYNMRNVFGWNDIKVTRRNSEWRPHEIWMHDIWNI